MRIQFLFLLGILIPFSGYAQDNLIPITLEVISEETGKRVNNATVVSFHFQESYGCEADGEWKLKVMLTDSFRIAAMGYELKTFVLPDSIERFSIYTIKLSTHYYMLNEVTVHKDFNLHLPDYVKLGQAKPFNKYKNAAPTKTPISSSSTYMNPVFTIKNMIGRKQRTTRKLYSSLMKNKSTNDKKRELLTKEVIQEISHLEGDQLQRFIVYCNINVQVNKADNETIIRLRINNALLKFLEAEDVE